MRRSVAVFRGRLGRAVGEGGSGRGRDPGGRSGRVRTWHPGAPRAGIGAGHGPRAILADDPGRESRQVGVVAADGRAAAHTGTECLAWAGHRVGNGYAVQGNILAAEAVVTGMERAFLENEGSSLDERLVSALEAGQAAGGDVRGQQSSAIVVERVGAAAE